MKVSQIQHLQHKLNQNYLKKSTMPVGAMSMPIDGKSYADSLQKDNGVYGKALLGIKNNPSFGAIVIDDILLWLAIASPFLLGACVTLIDIIRSQYDTKIAMEQRLLQEAEVQNAFNEEINKIANSMNLSPKNAKKFHEKYLAVSYIKPNGKADKEIGMNAVRGYGLEKYTLMKDVLSPVVVAQKAIEKARKTQSPEDQIVAERAQKDIPAGVLLYGPPGTGKTYIASKIGEHLNHFDTKFIDLNIRGRKQDENIETFDNAIRDAQEHFRRTGNYTVILLNDTSAKLKGGSEEFDMLLHAMENAKRYGIMFVITINDPKLINKTLFRKGRLDIRMPIGEMKEFENADMINFALHSFDKTKEKVKDFDIQKVVDKIEEKDWAFTPAEFMDFAREMSKSSIISADEMINLMTKLVTEDSMGNVWNALTPETMQEFRGNQEFVNNLKDNENEA